MHTVFDEMHLRDFEKDSWQENYVINMVYNDAAPRRMLRWLLDQNLQQKVRVGVIVYRTMIGNNVIARAKVLLLDYTDPPGKITGQFYHEEPLNEFPSDVLKTKIILVTGGA